MGVSRVPCHRGGPPYLWISRLLRSAQTDPDRHRQPKLSVHENAASLPNRHPRLQHPTPNRAVFVRILSSNGTLSRSRQPAIRSMQIMHISRFLRPPFALDDLTPYPNIDELYQTEQLLVHGPRFATSN
jgi:hypothetical protein